MKTIEEQIVVMQHYANGGKIECCFLGSHNWSEVTAQDYLFDFREFKYRIKEQKKTVTIEKWLIEHVGQETRVVETTNIELYAKYAKKVKLLETYEVEL